MKKTHKKRTSPFQTSIMLGFLALYLICMLCSTYLVKEGYEANYKEEFTNKVLSLCSSVIESYFPKFKEDGTLSENYIQELTYALSSGLKDGDKYNQFCAAIYGPDGSIIARTTEYFGETTLTFSDGYNSHFTPDAMVVNSPYDYFTDEEIEILLGYIEEENKERQKGNGIRDSYEIYLTYDQYTGEPLQLEISRQQMNQEYSTSEYGVGFNSYELLGDPELLWQWTNPALESENEIDFNGGTNGLSSSITNRFSFPYSSEGRKYYDMWKNNADLQNFNIEEILYDGKSYNYISRENNSGNRFVVYPLDLYGEYDIDVYEQSIYLSTEKTEYALQVNQVTYPWLAAVEYMKFMYLFGFLLMLVCMGITIYTTKKAYAKQMELEQTRRDFTNAVAHELKTPLAIVRNILENMEREKSEEKNNRYRQEGIHQTEVMDDMIKEMIFISKLDADKMKLRQESVSILPVIEEQMKRLEHLIEEKNIQVQYWKEDNFLVNGDRVFLEKAIFNLLENAVSYNRSDGRILIHLEKNSCVIENTADPIPEEDLPYIYDMFFTSNKSRKSDVNHRGLGLYLAKRIFDMHALELRVVNTEIGVKAIFSK